VREGRGHHGRHGNLIEKAAVRKLGIGMERYKKQNKHTCAASYRQFLREE
jgi:hypothetical protein